MRWIAERAEALLQLRCIELNGQWNDFIRFVHASLALGDPAVLTVSALASRPLYPPFFPRILREMSTFRGAAWCRPKTPEVSMAGELVVMSTWEPDDRTNRFAESPTGSGNPGDIDTNSLPHRKCHLRN